MDAGAPEGQRRSRGARSVFNRIADVAAEEGESPAIVSQEETCSYAELIRRSAAVAAAIAPRILPALTSRRRVIAVYLPRSVELAAALLGVLRSGYGFTVLDPAAHTERLKQVVNDARPALFVTHPDHAEGAARLIARLSLPVELAVVDSRSRGPTPADEQVVTLSSDDLFYLIYTSGSTGAPKGTAVPHRSIPGFIGTPERPLYPPGCRILFHSNISWDVLLLELFGPLLVGGVSIVNPEPQLSIQGLCEQIARHRVNTLWLAASQLNTIADSHLDALAGLTTVIAGGEALSVPHVLAVRDRFPMLRVINGYGPSETSVFATCFEIPPRFTRTPKAIPIGRSIGDRAVYVVDALFNRTAPGLAGELCVGGDAVPWGYLDRPSLTAERFIPDPFSKVPGARLYRTGDLVRELSSGELEYLRRNDDQVKIRGYRVELSEIKAVISKRRDVRRAAVLAMRDRLGQQRIVAFVVPQEGAAITAAQLLEDLGSSLPDYMVPTAVRLLDAFPLNANGKLDRGRLPNPLTEAELVEPATEVVPSPAAIEPMEALLVDLWKGALKVDQVSIDDNFFGLGGHSLTAMLVAFEVFARTGIDVRRVLFERPVLRDLARYLKESMLKESMLKESMLTPSGEPGAERGDPEPSALSHEQQRLWFLQASAPEDASYNVPLRVQIRGQLTDSDLDAALHLVVSRHEVLSTVVSVKGTELTASHRPASELKLKALDLSSWGAEGARTSAELLLKEEASRPFGLEKEIPIRAMLIRLSAEEAVLLVTFHHICIDAWSIEIFLRELRDAYRAQRETKPPSVAPARPTYAHYVRWQRRALTPEKVAPLIAYWTERLARATREVALPLGPNPGPGRGGRSVGTTTLTLSGEDTLALQRYCRSAGVTPFAVTLAAFMMALSSLSGQRDLCVGTPISGRRRLEDTDVIGMFANTVVMRGAPLPELTFGSFVAQTWRTAQEAIAHGDLPFDLLVEKLSPKRIPGKNPLFEILFTHHRTDALALDIGGTSFDASVTNMNTSGAKFDLSLGVHEDVEGSLRILLEYVKGAFAEEVPGALLDRFVSILRAGVLEPELTIAALAPSAAVAQGPAASGNQRGQAAPRPERASVLALFEGWAARTPDRTAIELRGARLSYRELNERANKLAHFLFAQSRTRPGDSPIIGVALERGLDLFVALLGIMKSGAAYVPLDLAHPDERLRFMLEETGAARVITNDAHRARLVALGRHVVSIDGDWSRIDRLPSGHLGREIRPDDVAYVMYTSGTTGRPKGVVVLHEGVSRVIHRNGYLELSPESKMLLLSPLTFDISVIDLWGGLVNGGQTVILPSDQEVLDQLRTSPDLFGANVLMLVPSLFNHIVEENPGALRGRTFLVAGDVMSVKHTRAALEELGAARVLNCYGPTETTVFATAFEVKAGDISDSIPIGWPIAETQIYLLDEALNPVEPGGLGEIYIGGTGVARGYLARPGLTAASFLPDPVSRALGARMYRTGDLGRARSDGCIEFWGRRDSQVKIRGVRIELGEVEVVLRAVAGVKEAVVVVSGQSDRDRVLVGYFVPAEDSGPRLLESLQDALAEKLPAVMIPTFLVALDALPMTANGKIDRKRLPAPDATATRKVVIAPRTEIEIALASIWRDILGTTQISLNDDFFSLGGHSLLMVRVASLVEQRWKVRIPMRDLLEGTLLSEMARTVTIALILRAEREAEVAGYLSQLPTEEARALLDLVRSKLAGV